MQCGKAGLRYNTTGEPFLHIRFPGTRLSVLSRPPFLSPACLARPLRMTFPAVCPLARRILPALPAEYPAGRRIFRLEITMDARCPLSGAALFIFSGSERLRTAMIIFYSAVTPYAYAGFLPRFSYYRRAQKKNGRSAVLLACILSLKTKGSALRFFPPCP